MKNQYFYAKEKLENAIYGLAVGPGDVRERLLGAFLAIHTLRDEDFPKGLKKLFKWIKQELTKYKPELDYDDRGSLQYTLSKIKNKTGARIAEKIYDLRTKLNLFTEE